MTGCSNKDSSTTDSNTVESSTTESTPSVIESEFLKTLIDTDTKQYKNLDEISSEIAKDGIISYPISADNVNTYKDSALYYLPVSQELLSWTDSEYNTSCIESSFIDTNTKSNLTVLVSKNITNAKEIFGVKQTLYGYAKYDHDKGVVYFVPFIYGTAENYKSIPDNINMLKQEIIDMSKK
jgi:hypothetical protein